MRKFGTNKLIAKHTVDAPPLLRGWFLNQTVHVRMSDCHCFPPIMKGQQWLITQVTKLQIAQRLRPILTGTLTQLGELAQLGTGSADILEARFQIRDGILFILFVFDCQAVLVFLSVQGFQATQ